MLLDKSETTLPTLFNKTKHTFFKNKIKHFTFLDHNFTLIAQSEEWF